MIGVVGLPGSGKSRVMEGPRREGYDVFDDAYGEDQQKLHRAKQSVEDGKPIVFSDIMLCAAKQRKWVASEVITPPIHWIFFENALWVCTENSIVRFLFENSEKRPNEEIKLPDLMKAVSFRFFFDGF